MIRLLSEPNIDYKENIRFINPRAQPTATNDPYFFDVLLWLRMEGADGGTNFVDSGPLGLTVSRQGTSPPTISTSQFKYGSSSAFFAANQTGLSANDSRLALGTSPFTIEFWGYKISNTAIDDGAFSWGTTASSGSNPPLVRITSSSGPSTIYPFTNGSNSADVFPANQWNHVALVRTGTGTNQAKAYLNGAEIWVGTFNTNVSQTFVNIGWWNIIGTNGWDGWIDSFRVTKNIARYIEPFNPETATFLTI